MKISSNKVTDVDKRHRQEDYSIRLVDVDDIPQEPLIIALFGDPGAGKSNFIGSAHGKIGAIPMENKSRQSIVKAAKKFGRKVQMPEIDLVRSHRAALVETMPDACVSEADFKSMKPEDAIKKAERIMQKKAEEIPLDGARPTCCQRCTYRWHANRVKSVAYRMADDDEIKTIAIDPFGTFVDDMLFACYGRNEKIMPLDRKTFNREVCDFLNAISHKHLILTHYSSTIWKDNKPTSKTKPQNSFSKIGHYTSVVIEMNRDEDKEFGDGRYSISVKDCQANAELIGQEGLLEDDGISFDTIGSLVYPDTWEVQD